MATKISKEKFRYSSAAYQFNKTNETKLDFYKKWIFEEPIDDEGRISEDFMGVEGDKGTDAIISGGNVFEELQKLNNKIDGFEVYYDKNTMKKPTKDLLDPNNRIRSIIYIAFIKSFGLPDHKNNKVEPNEKAGKRVYKYLQGLEKKIIGYGKDQRDLQFLDGIQDIFSYYQDDPAEKIEYLYDFTGEIIDDYEDQLIKFKKNYNDILLGNKEFEFISTKKGNAIDVPSGDHISMLFMYNKVPSKTGGRPQMRIFNGYFMAKKPYYFNEVHLDVRTPILHSMSQNLSYMNQLVSHFKSLESNYSSFSTKTNNLSDDDLRDIKKELREIKTKMEKLVKDGYYLEMDDTFFPNVFPKDQSTISSQLYPKLSEVLGTFYNNDYKRFLESYVKLFDSLEESRNI